MSHYTTGIKVGKVSLPGAFSTSIMARAFKENELRAIYDSYVAAKKTHGSYGPPTDLQVKAAKLRKEGLAYKDIEVKLGMKKGSAFHAVSRVAVWEYLNGSK